VAPRTEAVTPRACERVTLDTTVQTRAVAHPTDNHLLMRGIERLNALAKKHGLVPRQSFPRLGRLDRDIGHAKSDGLLERNHLAGSTGDAINAILVAAGHNLRLLVAWLTALLRALFTAWLPACEAEMLTA